MNDPKISPNSRLSKIETLWSVVRKAHESENEISTTAQQQLLEIYGGAIRNYLLGALKNEDLADDLFQEFALKFVNGDFRRVDSSKGHFRAYVKTILSRMIAGHFRKLSKRREKMLVEDGGQVEAGALDSVSDEKFLVSWRDDLLAQTWQRLAEYESESGAPYHTLLHLRSSQSTLNSDELAEKLSRLVGKTFASGAVRVALHRAREKFAKLMIEIVSASLQEPTPENLEAELIDLRLIEYCRKVLKSQAND